MKWLLYAGISFVVGAHLVLFAMCWARYRARS